MSNSELVISTRTISQDVGTLLKFDNNGVIVSTDPIAREARMKYMH